MSADTNWGFSGEEVLDLLGPVAKDERGKIRMWLTKASIVAGVISWLFRMRSSIG